MGIVGVVVLLGALDVIHIAVAALLGCSVMLMTRCLRGEDAYRAVDWRSIFLIAGMLPLGTAMERTGAASWLARTVLDLTAPLGPWGALGWLG